jgi:ubiquinone biosynthesis protein Coq4
VHLGSDDVHHFGGISCQFVKLFHLCNLIEVYILTEVNLQAFEYSNKTLPNVSTSLAEL